MEEKEGIMREKIILHIDINHCYAQMEEARHPQLKDVPMCVGGSEKTRSGIVLARNLHAKKFKVTTAEPLRDSFKKCPQLIVIQPDYDYYQYTADRVKDIYREYTDLVESFGIDEAWVDLTHSCHLFGTPIEVAQEIQQRVLDEIGLTVSVGLSYNKIFSKLGSDYRKPAGLTVITKDNFKKIVWPLPCQDLLNVGPSTQKHLNVMQIYTIGDIAQADPITLDKQLGKMGAILWNYANGLEDSDVSIDRPQAKSIGNGITPPKDMTSFDETKLVLYVLTESICSRMKEAGLMASVIALRMRDTNLITISRQITLQYPSHVVGEIMPVVLQLLKDNYYFTKPLRSITITGSKMVSALKQNQINMFEEEHRPNQELNLDNVMDDIRDQFGHDSIKRANMLLREDLTGFNPKGEHTIFPGGFQK